MITVPYCIDVSLSFISFIITNFFYFNPLSVLQSCCEGSKHGYEILPRVAGPTGFHQTDDARSTTAAAVSCFHCVQKRPFLCRRYCYRRQARRNIREKGQNRDKRENYAVLRSQKCRGCKTNPWGNVGGEKLGFFRKLGSGCFAGRVVDPHWFNADPDPAFSLIAEPDPVPKSRVLMTKNWKKFTAVKLFKIFFGLKITIYLSLSLHKGSTSYRRSLKRTSSTFKHENSLLFLYLWGKSSLYT